MKLKQIASLMAVTALLTSAAVAIAADQCSITNNAMGAFATPLTCVIPGPTTIKGTAWGTSNVSITVNLNGGTSGTSFARSRGYNSLGTYQVNCEAQDTNTSSGISNTSSTNCGTVVRQDLLLVR